MEYTYHSANKRKQSNASDDSICKSCDTALETSDEKDTFILWSAVRLTAAVVLLAAGQAMLGYARETLPNIPYGRALEAGLLGLIIGLVLKVAWILPLEPQHRYTYSSREKTVILLSVVIVLMLEAVGKDTV